MLDRSSALNRAWENASVDYTKRFKRNRAGKRGRTDTFSISLSPLPAIHSSRRSKLIDAGAMYVCVLLLPAAIITVLYITQMLLLLDGDTLRVALLLQLDRCNQLQPVSPAVISPHFWLMQLVARITFFDRCTVKCLF